MLLNINTDPSDNSSCKLTYNEQEGWIEALWCGYVDPEEAMRGAEAYLRNATRAPCAFLLNNNTALRGPWFDSLDWLADVWLPQAVRIGLRYVAHLVQADRPQDIISMRLPRYLPFELQIFQHPADAQNWLRECRDAEAAAAATR